jgi:hypothetical protein
MIRTITDQFSFRAFFSSSQTQRYTRGIGFCGDSRRRGETEKETEKRGSGCVRIETSA